MTRQLVRVAFLFIGLIFALALAVPAFSQPAPTPAPASLNLAAGAKVELFAESDGTPPITFEWFKGGVKIGDGATYVIASATAADAGVYHVKASNVVGSAVSPTVTLAVFTMPGIPAVKVRVTMGSSTAPSAAKTSGALPVAK